VKEPKAMDGMMVPHLVVGNVDTEAGPRPYCTSDTEALRAVSTAHARAMARQAGAIAEACGVALDARAWADRAAREAVRHHDAVSARRVFHADRLHGLRDAGRLTDAQYRAAVEIGDLLQWFEAGKQVLARSQFSERLAASTSTVALHQRLEEAERLRYRPWRAWAAAYPVKPGRSVEDLVRAFIVQGLGLRQLASAFRMDQRRAERLLLRALSCYAVTAGWEAGANDA
jgi:hypothetical protein